MQKEGVVTIFLAGSALLTACLLLLSSWQHWQQQALPTINREEIESAKSAVKAAEMRFDQARNDFKKLGPEPSFWHPYDHWCWDKQKQLRDQASAEFTKAQDFRNNLLASGISIPDWIKRLWNEVISPLLHIFLSLALLSFSARVVFRYLLLKEKIGATKL